LSLPFLKFRAYASLPIRGARRTAGQLLDAGTDQRSKYVMINFSIFKWRRLRWLLLTQALLLNGLAVYLDGPLLGTDQGFQTAAAISMLAGHGITNPVFEVSDVSATVYKPLVWWPPLYSFMAAGMMAIIHDPWWVTLLLTALARAGLLIAIFLLLESLDIDSHIKVLMWLYWAFIYPPTTSRIDTGPTDYWSDAFFVLGVAFAVHSLVVARRKYLWSGLAGVAIGMTSAFRYAGAPLIAILPAGYSFYFVITRDRKYISHAIICASCSALLVLPTIVFQRTFSGAGQLYSAIQGSAVLPPLANVSPFPIIAFGLGNDWLPGSEHTVLLWMMSGFVLEVFIAILCVHIIRAFRARALNHGYSDPSTFLYAVGFFTIVLVTGMLIYLSAVGPRLVRTFANESRYYVPTSIFLVLALFTAVSRKHVPSTAWRIPVAVFLLAVTTVAGASELYHWELQLSRNSKPGIGTNIDKEWMFYDKIKELRASGEQVAFLDAKPNNWYKAWANVAGASIYGSIHIEPDLRILGDSDGVISTSRKTTLLLLTDRNGVQSANVLKGWIQQSKASLIGSTAAYDLYKIALADSSHLALKDVPLDKVASAVDFSFSQPAPGTGWSVPENNRFTWMNARQATLEYTLATDRSYRITFHVFAGMTTQILNSLRLSVNGQHILLSKETATAGGWVYSGVIPKSVLGARSEKTQLTFQVDNVISSRELGVNEDMRTLAVLFEWLRLDPM
jgi:hypothetical protein